MPMEFRYFRAPESEMCLLPYIRTCSLCGQSGRCFSLDSLINRELSEEGRQGKIGCLECLKRDRFGFAHDTEVGYITEDGLETYGEYESKPQRIFLVTGDGEAAVSDTPLAALPKPQVSDEAISELRRTPSFATWQEILWPVHHSDFMAYAGHDETGTLVLFDCLHCRERIEIDDPD